VRRGRALGVDQTCGGRGRNCDHQAVNIIVDGVLRVKGILEGLPSLRKLGPQALIKTVDEISIGRLLLHGGLYQPGESRRR
jgi:hypothetical protein